MDYNQQKRAIFEALLPACPFMAVDGTAAGVELPDDLRVVDLVLRIGNQPHILNMPNLVFTDAGWRGTISQQGRLTGISIPWHAVSRCWLGEPFPIGCFTMWPDQAQVPTVKRPALSVVRKTAVVTEPNDGPKTA